MSDIDRLLDGPTGLDIAIEETDAILKRLYPFCIGGSNGGPDFMPSDTFDGLPVAYFQDGDMWFAYRMAREGDLYP